LSQDQTLHQSLTAQKESTGRVSLFSFQGTLSFFFRYQPLSRRQDTSYHTRKIVSTTFFLFVCCLPPCGRQVVASATLINITWSLNISQHFFLLCSSPIPIQFFHTDAQHFPNGLPGFLVQQPKFLAAVYIDGGTFSQYGENLLYLLIPIGFNQI
ncbi:hypothetical protein SAMN05444955_110162, partial [Lihuaxuella thermophila]